MIYKTAARACMVGFFCFLVRIDVTAADVLKGDEAAQEGESFSFRVQQHVQSTFQDVAGANFYVGAHPDDGGAGKVKNFALAQANRTIGTFTPLASEKATLNRSADQPNPLFDQGIAHLTLFEGKSEVGGAPEQLVAVTKADPKTVYLVHDFRGGQAVLVSVENVPDANGDVTAGIVDLAAANPFVFAAVKANGGSFGDPGSGILPLILGFLEIKQDGSDDADKVQRIAVFTANNTAFPLDRTSPEVKIQNNLASIDDVVDMHWDSHLGRLYIALRVKAGAGANDGARAIVVAQINAKSVFSFSSIGPDALFAGTNKIVGATGANEQVSIHKVRTMLTSTSLPYLIVQGGVGAPGATKRLVFALPLVSGNTDPAVNGTIAKKDANPKGVFTAGTVQQFVRNDITEPALVVGDMTTDSDGAAKVGCAALPNGDITDMFVQGDAVFVSVQNPDANQKPGIFVSQAIFDAAGKIKAWTQWRRAAGTQDKVFGLGLDPRTGNMTFMAANNSDVKTVKRTAWADGDAQGLAQLVKHISTELPQEDGGVHGVRDLPLGTPGLKDISLLIATGRNKIVLAETGKKDGAAFIPHGGAAFSAIEQFDNGTITKNFPVGDTKVVSIEDAALGDIGPIVTAEVATDGGSNGWLFVGGSNGVAVLSKANGAGWNPATQLATGLAGLTNGMSFKTIGDYRFVRKLIADGTSLYVLTDTQLDRIDLTKGNVGIDNLVVRTLATLDDLIGVGAGGSLLDLVISGKFALLGTSVGLFRAGNGPGVSIATNATDVAWTFIPLPEGVGPVTHIFPTSVTGRMQDLANGFCGQVYVLSGYRGLNQARLYRLAIKDVQGVMINDTTVQLFPDLFVKDIPSYFASFGAFRNLFATDGALYLLTRGKEGFEDPVVHLLVSQTGIRGGVQFLGVTTASVPVSLDNATLIATLVRNFASGSWLLGGDFGGGGIRVNE